MLKRGDKMEVCGGFGLEIIDEIYSDINSGRALFKAKNPHTGLIYALKAFDDKNDPNSIEKEIKATNASIIKARLNSPKIHLRFKNSGLSFLLMDWMEGRNLAQIFTAPPRDINELKIRLNICEKLAHALSNLHKNGIIHRDLKPQNVMILGDFSVSSERQNELLKKCELSIIDFGLSSQRRIAGGAGEGTAGYRAPEQQKGGSDAVGKHTDIFALGQIISFLTLGAPIDFGWAEGFGPNFKQIPTLLNGENNPLSGRILESLMALNKNKRASDLCEIAKQINQLKRELK